MIKRTIEEKLLAWKNDKYRKPLLITGARQVGKTYTVKNIFGPQNFKRMIYVDFREDQQTRKFVKNHPSAKMIIDYLSVRYETEIDSNTLLFFDEIQEALQILTASKYFNQDFPDIPVIMTGSLVRIKLKQLETNLEKNTIVLDTEIAPENQDGHNNFLYPVGKLEQIDMYPMTFDEFLFNYKPKLYELVKDSFNKRAALTSEIHQLALETFYLYLQIGGMPESINAFIETNSILRSTQIIQRIYTDYLSDMGLYQISPQTIIRSRKVYENIYTQLNKENKNFKISEIEKGKRFRDYLTPFDWLELARLVYKCNILKEHVTLPLISENESLFRVYLPDCGLFAIQSKMNQSSFQECLRNNTLSGIFMENYVAIEFQARNIPLFYWKGKTTSEFEFILDINNAIIPLDVKKNKGSLKSLEIYKTLNHYEYSIKISKNNYGFDAINKIETIPFYYLSFYLNELKEKSLL